MEGWSEEVGAACNVLVFREEGFQVKKRFAPKEEIRDSYRKGLQEEKPISESLNWPLDGREMALEPLSLRTEENNHRNEETRRGMLIRAGSNTASAAF